MKKKRIKIMNNNNNKLTIVNLFINDGDLQYIQKNFKKSITIYKNTYYYLNNKDGFFVFTI